MPLPEPASASASLSLSLLPFLPSGPEAVRGRIALSRSALSFSSAEFRPLSRESRAEAEDDRVLRRVGYTFTDGDTGYQGTMSSGYDNGEWGLREALQMFHMLSNLNLGEAKE